MEKYKRKSLKLNMVLNGIKGLMGIIFPLISFPYISRILGVESIGKYSFANSLISYFTLISGLGIATYAIREGARIREDKILIKHFSNEMFSINIISTFISYFILVTFLFTQGKFHDYKDILIILSLQIIFKTIGVEWIYSIYEDYTYITVRSILFQVISLLLMFLFVHNEDDVNIYAAITVVSSVGSNILNYFHSKKYCKIQWSKQIDWNKHLKPIMILFAMSITVTIYVSMDITILGYLCGDYTVGIYSVSTKVYTIIKTVLSSVIIVSIPRLSSLLGKGNNKGFCDAATEIYKILISIMLPVITGIIVLSKQIILIISGSEYINAKSSLVLLSIALFFCLGAWFWGQCILVPLKQEKIVFTATIISALLNIGLNFLLIPIWRENAAAFSTVIAEAVAFVWCMRVGKSSVELKSVRKIICKVIVGCLAIILCGYILKPLNDQTEKYTIMTIFISSILYLLIELLLKNEVVINITSEAKKLMNNNRLK